MNHKKSISKIFLTNIASITTATIVLLAAIFISVKIYECKRDCALITEAYINEQEEIVKYEVERVVNNIRYGISNSCITNETEKIKYIEQLRAVRFHNKGKEPGIFFVKSYDGVQLLSVSSPEIEGKDVSEYTDPERIVTHILFMNTISEKGYGFADYSWYNPFTGKVQKKRSFIKALPEFEWYVGGGFWFEDIHTVIIEKQNDLKKYVLRYLFFITLIIIVLYILMYMISRKISLKIEDAFNKFSLFFGDAATQNVLINKDDFNYSEFNKLADSANKMILQRKQTEELLKESEERWKFALEGSGDGIWDWNAITNEVFFSSQWKTMLGYEDHEIENVLHEWDTRLHPDDRDEAYKDLNNHLNGETDIYVNEHRLRCKNGSYKWILDRGKVIDWSAESKPIRVIGTLTDISIRKKNEETINQNEIRNQLILDSAMDGFWIVDKKGNIIEINEIYSKLSGYSKRELLKMKVYDLEAIDDKQNVNQRIEKLIQDGGRKIESVHKKKNGDLWDVEVNIKYLEINEGLFVTFIHDITQRKLDEKKIKESEEKYRLLAENQNDLLIKISPEKIVLYANLNYCATFGVKEHEILGKTFLPLIHNDDVEIVAKSLANLVKPPYKTYHEERAKTVDGWRWFGWSVKANLDNSKNITEMIAVGRDITEQKETEIELDKYRENLEGIVKNRTQEVEVNAVKLKESQTALLYLLEDVNESSDKLRITNDQLEMANKEMEAFSYSVSHDLRAPLTRLDGFSSALSELYKDKLDEKGKHYLSRIKASSRKMEQLIEDLLSLSRISRQEILKSVVNISAIADKILKDLRKVEPQRKVIVKIEKSIEIFCDSKLITILLQNILSNAWKFTSKNTESIIEIGTKNIDNKMEVFIKDNGVGFNMKYLDKVFLPFQRLHTESEFEGTGIGMATVHRIVKRHDAEINVESEIGKGTTFYLNFSS
jgi:PAS domain S-box-containing protein